MKVAIIIIGLLAVIGLMLYPAFGNSGSRPPVETRALYEIGNVINSYRNDHDHYPSSKEEIIEYGSKDGALICTRNDVAWDYSVPNDSDGASKVMATAVDKNGRMYLLFLDGHVSRAAK